VIEIPKGTHTVTAVPGGGYPGCQPIGVGSGIGSPGAKHWVIPTKQVCVPDMHAIPAVQPKQVVQLAPPAPGGHSPPGVSEGEGGGDGVGPEGSGVGVGLAQSSGGHGGYIHHAVIGQLHMQPDGGGVGVGVGLLGHAMQYALGGGPLQEPV